MTLLDTNGWPVRMYLARIDECSGMPEKTLVHSDPNESSMGFLKKNPPPVIIQYDGDCDYWLWLKVMVLCQGANSESIQVLCVIHKLMKRRKEKGNASYRYSGI